MPRVSDVTAAVVVGAVEVAVCASFGALIFGPAGPDAVADGIGFVLIGAALLMLSFALRSSVTGDIASIQDVPAAIIGVIAGAVVADVPAGAAFGTLVAAVMVTGLVTSVTFALLGRFRLGAVARFLPFPVVAGFLGGTGWLLLVGGVGSASGVTPDLLDRGSWTLGPTPGVVVAGVAVGVALLVVSRMDGPSWILAAAIAAVVVGVHVVRVLTGTSVDEGVVGGWLLDTGGATGELSLAVTHLPDADWAVVLRQLPAMLSVALLAPVGLILNLAGLELETGEEADVDRDLRSAGGVNLAVAALGGVGGWTSLSLSGISRRIAGPRRVVGAIAAGVVVGFLVAGPALLRLLPTPLLTGLLVFLGLDFLASWLVATRRTLPSTEHGVVVLIVVAIATLGFLQGLAAGLLAAVVLFARTSSRVDPVRVEASGDRYRSRAERTGNELAVLRDHGGEILVIGLQGYVFFGTSYRLFERVAERLEGAEQAPLRHVVIDLRRVTGLDSSATASMERIRRRAEGHGAELALTSVRTSVAAQLAVGGYGDGTPLRGDLELDVVLQRCEDEVLSRHDHAVGMSTDAREVLVGELGASAAAALVGVMADLHAPAGATVLAAGTVADELMLIVRGRLSAVAVGSDGGSLRLRSLRAGSLVGEVGLLLGEARTADVVADVATDLLVLERAQLEELTESQPAVGAAVQAMLARELAVRLRDSVRMIETLLD